MDHYRLSEAIRGQTAFFVFPKGNRWSVPDIPSNGAKRLAAMLHVELSDAQIKRLDSPPALIGPENVSVPRVVR